MRVPTRYNAVSALVGGGISGSSDGAEIEYHGKTPPTESAITAKLAELLAAHDAQEYARSRKEEYDALNQFELMSDDSINGTTTHKDAILAIKAKYPKPE